MDRRSKLLLVGALLVASSNIVGAVDINSVSIKSVSDFTNSSNYSANTELNLKRDLTFSSSDSNLPTSFNGNNNITLSGDNHTVDGGGLNKGGFRFWGNGNFKIQNITLKNFILDNNNLLGIKGRSSSSLQNTIIRQITENTTSPVYGGTILLASGSSISKISNSTFDTIKITSSNTSEVNGGAIYVQGDVGDTYGTSSIASISNSIFNNVNLKVSGVNAYGGVINNEGIITSIDNNTRFSNNTLTAINGKSGYGGAISNGDQFARTGVKITNIDSVTFENNAVITNRGVAQGGAIWNKVGSIIENISNTKFINNIVNTGTYGARGGAIYNAGTISALSKGTFTGNGQKDGTAVTQDGGAIYNSGTITSIAKSTFTGNKSKGYGGAIYNNNGTIGTISNSTFTDNIANSAGGAIYTDRDLIIRNSSFSNNVGGSNSNDIYLRNEGDNVANLIIDYNHTVDNSNITSIGSGLASTDSSSTLTIKNGAQLNLSGLNWTFSGKTNVEKGILNFEKIPTSSFVTGVVEVGDTGILNYTTSNTDRVDGTLEHVNTLLGTGFFNKYGIGHLNIDSTGTQNADKFTGTINLNEGRLDINAAAQDASAQRAQTFDFSVVLGGQSKLNYIANANGSAGDRFTLNEDAKLSFANTALDAAINFKTGTYSLIGDLENATGNNISFNNAKVIAGGSTFGGNYSFAKKTTLNIIDNATFNGYFTIADNISAITANAGANVLFNNLVLQTGTNIRNIGSGVVTINGISGTGALSHSNGALVLGRDLSSYSSGYTQIGGSTTVTSSGKLFGGGKNIDGGSLDITSDSAIDYSNVHLGNSVQMTHKASTNTNNSVSSSNVDFTGSGANLLFTSSSGVTGNYILNSKIDNGSSNNITFENSNLKLGTVDYTGATKYNLKNSTLDLIENGGTLNDVQFTNLTTEGANKLSFNVNINNGTIETDKLLVQNGNAQFSLGKIFITGTENGQTEYNTSRNVLSGSASFVPSSTTDVVTVTGATTAYKYIISTLNDYTIKMNATRIASENSLNIINTTSGNRFFQFSVGNTAEYHIGSSLGSTQAGDFYITGRNENASSSVLSGAIVDSTLTPTGTKGSLFNIANGVQTNLDIRNLTIQEAQKTGNGSVVENNSGTSVVTLNNTIIQNNLATGNGGAIYNGAGKLNISNSIFKSNSATLGGAIYNRGTMNLENVTFDTPTSTAQNDIYNNGIASAQGTNLFNSDIINYGTFNFAGNNTINGNISGLNTSSIANNGTLNLNGDNSGYLGTFTQNSGITNVSNKFFGGTSTINGGTFNWYTQKNLPTGAKLLVENGNLNIGSDSNIAILTLNTNSSIKDTVQTNINRNSYLNIAGGSANINNNDNWLGTINLSDGTLYTNLPSNSNAQNGRLNATGGNLNIDSGILNIAQNSTITEDVNLNIANNTRLNITGGDVAFNSGDNWSDNAEVRLNSGNLIINNISSNGKLFAQSGNLNLNNGTLTVTNGSYIASDVNTVINPGTNLLIENEGTVNINNNDSWNGTITLDGGNLNYGTTSSGTLLANNGNLNLLNGSILNIETPSTVQGAVNVDIQNGATVNLSNSSIFNLDANDKWNGKINNTGGILNTTGLSNSTLSGGALIQTSGTSTFKDSSHIFITDENSFISGGNINILNNSSLYMGSETADLFVDTLTMSNNSTMNVLNGVIDESEMTNMVINGTNHVNIDIAPRYKVGDTYIISNLSSASSGTLNISDFNFIGLAPIDKNIKLQVFDADNISNVEFTATDKSIFTPIGNYQLFSQGGGAYSASLTSYNPQVYRGQVATMAMYNHQLLVGDMLTNHFILPHESYIDKMAQNSNRYASANVLFAPYQNTIDEGGLWVKNYVSFETLSMTHGLNVGNNVYGTLVGADFPAIQMKNGWKFIPTAYIGYNGGNQNFNHVDMYQNGGQGGLMGTFVKKDFIGSIVAYGGGYFNEMNVAGNSDKTGNWFAGTAAKLAYNLHATKHFTIQPTAMISYNIFGKQNWGTDFGVMSMNSGLMNGINVAPGLNLIYARDSWSVYGTFQYMFNINDHIGGSAGHVNLPTVSMRHGYFQYGIGVTKTWKDRLSSYLQFNIRNGGRTGVGFQLGLRYTFGKGGNKSNTDLKTSKNITPELPKTRIKLFN